MKKINVETQKVVEEFIMECLPTIIHREKTVYSTIYNLLTERGECVANLMEYYLKREGIECPYTKDDFYVEQDVTTYDDLKLIRITFPEGCFISHAYMVYQLDENMDIVNQEYYVEIRNEANTYCFNVSKDGGWESCFPGFFSEYSSEQLLFEDYTNRI